MKIDIIICYIPRYNRGHMVDFVPPITGIHLAAITPPEHSVRVIHQQVEEIDLNTDADLIALSFFSGFAPMAFHLSGLFKARGKFVVAGGPHVTYNTTEAEQHFDAIVTGEAENAWPKLLEDIRTGNPKKIYQGGPNDLSNIPTPRYNLLSSKYFIRKVVQATRGCYYKCSFCSVPTLNPGYRMRLVEDVIRDASYDNFSSWWQRKVIWFWDDNLLINRKYSYNLLEALIPLKKWWLTQASIDIAEDEKLLSLMKKSGCIGVFLGIESFSSDALDSSNKKQNKLKHYKLAIKKIRSYGICVMAGLISGFESDTETSILSVADKILEMGIDVPFISVLTPFKGTPLYDDFKKQRRLLSNRGWQYYNGYNVAFQPKKLSPLGLLTAHRKLWRRAFSLSHSFRRIMKGCFSLRPGALLMSIFMNTFYGLKGVTGNLPRNMMFFESISLENQISTTNLKNNRA